MSKIELSAKDQAKLAGVLLPEEELQWTGHSDAFPLVCKENKTALIIRWVVCIICAVALSVLYAVWVSSSGGTYSIVIELLIIVVFAYCAILIPVLDRRSLIKTTLYCVTNKRILVLVADRPAIALNRAGLNSRCVDGENGCVHILFGASIDTKPHKYRLTTIVPQTDKTGNNSIGAIFYNVKKKDVPSDILTFS